MTLFVSENTLPVLSTLSMELEHRSGEEKDDLGEMTIHIQSSRFTIVINEQSRNGEQPHPTTHRSVDGTL